MSLVYYNNYIFELICLNDVLQPFPLNNNCTLHDNPFPLNNTCILQDHSELFMCIHSSLYQYNAILKVPNQIYSSRRHLINLKLQLLLKIN